MTKSTRLKKKNESINQDAMLVKKDFIFGTGRRKLRLPEFSCTTVKVIL